MIEVIPDGIWCPQCKTLHPTLYWHIKYNEYLIPSQYYEQHRAARARFGLESSEEECKKAYHERLELKKIKWNENSGTCVVCSTPTNFMEYVNTRYVCSDECLYKLY